MVPCQRIMFFDFLIDSVAFNVYLTDDKVKKILTKAHELMKKVIVIIASFIGLTIDAL